MKLSNVSRGEGRGARRESRAEALLTALNSYVNPLRLNPQPEPCDSVLSNQNVRVDGGYDVFGETPKTARETRALPISNCMVPARRHLTPALSPTSWRRGRRSRGLRWVREFNARDWLRGNLAPALSPLLRRRERETASRGGVDMQARRAFTIIEIALCLGIIGFALVAIIAVLPRGLDVQKRNREETIVAQDADVWMNAIRNGARGFDDLTNYVICITNFWSDYDANYTITKSGNDYYTLSNSSVTSPLFSPTTDFFLTNGERIVGLLTMPKLLSTGTPTTPAFEPLPGYAFPPYQSNYIVAYVRAFSGAAVNNVPQTNTTILADAFIYRMIVENFPYAAVDTNSFCLDCPAALATNGMTTDEQTAWWVGRTNLTRTMWMLQTNSHEFRLRFRWPVLPNGQIPNYGLLTFRSMVSGSLLVTNDEINAPNQPLYFVQPANYTQVTITP